MFKRLKYTTGAMAAVAALGLGGAAIAGAAGSSPGQAPTAVTGPEPAGQVDGDNVRSGDQTTPDAAAPHAEAATAGDGADAGAGTAATESTASETATASDGPGGHADEPGSANANTVQQGQN